MASVESEPPDTSELIKFIRGESTCRFERELSRELTPEEASVSSFFSNFSKSVSSEFVNCDYDYDFDDEFPKFLSFSKEPAIFL